MLVPFWPNGRRFLLEVSGELFMCTELPPRDLLGRPLNEREAPTAPPLLQVTGKIPIPLPSPRVAIAGTRNPSPEGAEFARKLTENLVRKKVLIVSGLARGIDTTAHTTALENRGKTIAVLGTPLNQFYPPENKRLQLKLMRRQMVVSQFPIGSTVKRENFAIRNRTIALLSHASVIVEAGEKSGTVHLAWASVALDRPLFISILVQERNPSWLLPLGKYVSGIIHDPSEIDELLDLLP